MLFDPDNEVIKLCVQGMEAEGMADDPEAARLFMLAWERAGTAIERFVAAHYLARHQSTPQEKLKWDKVALEQALAIDSVEIQASYPSLYLNVAKGYEDLNDFENARNHYLKAMSFAQFLPRDGYGNLIRSGILNGLDRI